MSVRRQEGRGDRRKGAGFTLLEVLVALVIIALAATVALRSSSLAIGAADRSGTASHAALQARSLLSEIGVSRPLAEGVSEGRLEDGTAWRLAVAAHASPSPLLRAYDIVLTVTSGRSSVVLETRRALPADTRR